VNKGIIISGIAAITIIVVISVLITDVSDNENAGTPTGTPADNYSETDREKFCGVSEAKSTRYIKEYEIPTPCTQPQAIIVGPLGNIWIAQSNTGKLAKFNPQTETFTEYENNLWPKRDKSMIWGLDYSSDGFFWFTDDKHDSLWNFEVSTQKYKVLNHASLSDSSPQLLHLTNSTIIVNDFTGGKMMFFENPHSENVDVFSVPSNFPESINSGFTIDSQHNLWYTNWTYEGEGILGKINLTALFNSFLNEVEGLEIQTYDLPNEIQTPNGITSDNVGNIWIADSSSSLIFKFDSTTLEFTKYPTFKPSILSYGNSTGKIISPSSNPYWIEKDDYGRVVFNEQGANRIGIIDPNTESVIEYPIPSKNPHWGDCGIQENCGLAQVFDIAVDEKKIWFSEWAENSIGVVDTSLPLPVKTALETTQTIISQGKSTTLEFTVTSNSKNPIEISTKIINPNLKEISITNSEKTQFLDANSSITSNIEISVSPETETGEYKVLLGSATEDIIVGQYLTILVE
jgi:virginiamycin B lyase